MSNWNNFVTRFKFTLFNNLRVEALRRSATVCVSLLALSACGVGNSGQESDPVVEENPVAFIKRNLVIEDDVQDDDLRNPQAFRPGARLYIKDRASPSAPARDITSTVFSDPDFLNDDGELLYSVRDLSVSFDGTRLLFSMRAPEIENADEDEQPKWNIWEYDSIANTLTRLIASDTEAEAGHDLSPSYLPDGRILFTSTRQRVSKAILLDEGKSRFSAVEESRNNEAFVLHVLDPVGGTIDQLTYNQSHDLDPLLLQNGKILFSRWDNAGRTTNNGFNLYQVNPDGTEMHYVYGRHSHIDNSDGQAQHFANPLELENGNIVAQFRPLQTSNLASVPVEIDTANFVEYNLRVDGTSGTGQQALVAGVDTSGDANLNGTYGAAFPLYDGTNRYLVSWSPCRLVPIGSTDAPIEACTADKLASGNYEAAEPLYGLWLLDADTNTQLPIELPEEGQQYDEAVLMKARSIPNVIDAPVLDSDAQVLADQGYGTLHIRSVYDFDGVDTTPAGIAAMADPVQTPVDQRPARFLRLEKAVSLPTDEVRDIDNAGFGRSNAQGMREILGYVPIEPDGSVKVAVPANVAFAVSVLDESGKRTSQRHLNWLQVRPGEDLQCIGCHTRNSTVPHGRPDAEPDPANNGAVTTGVEFPNSEARLSPDMGETMAETRARIDGIRRLSADIVFDDEWTDDTVTPKAASFTYAYDDLDTPVPIAAPNCVAAWTSLCRVSIHYPNHIHPLWSVDRRIFDVDDVTVLEDRTCTACHTSTDDMGNARVADAHLDLTNGPSTDEPLHFKSYRELLFNDNEQEVVDGLLIDRLVDSGEVTLVPRLDGDGNPVLDGDGNPIIDEIPILVTVPVAPTMRTAGAANSDDFFSLFEAGGSHANFLTSAELKLIAEWLDLGAQYYNDPFLAPLD